MQSWPDTGEQLVPDIQEAVSKDKWARDILRRQIENTSPLETEETTWYTGKEQLPLKKFEEETDEEDKEQTDGEDMDANDDEDMNA